MKQREIEEFLAGEAEELERRREEPKRYVRRRGRPPLPAELRAGQVYSIRIPSPEIERIRALARRLECPPAVMMREWVLERLAKESRLGSGATVALVEPCRQVRRAERLAASRRPVAAAYERAAGAAGKRAAKNTRAKGRRSRA
ncbi:MAG: hypothetical protein HY775_01905 [Acidobacteria bacterium]|nr:hypothetical protein [Acidobacteriota bacterium]